MKPLISALVVILLTACGGGGSTISQRPVGGFVASTYGDSTQEAQGQPHAASRPGAQVYNRGVSGTNARQLLQGTDGRNPPWPQAIAQESAPIVVINHGINDYGRPLDDYRADLKTLVTIAQAGGKAVMLEQPNPAGETRTPLMDALAFDVAAFEQRRETMRAVAAALGVHFCPQPRVPLADGIHPTREGYAIKAERLADCIGEVL